MKNTRFVCGLLGVWLGVGSSSCSPGAEEATGDDVRKGARAAEIGYEGLFSLLTLEDRLTIVEQPEDSPLESRMMRPRGNGEGEYGERRSLVVRPRTRLAYDLPEIPAEAVLEYRVALRVNAYQGPGTVTVRGALGDRVLFQHALDCDPGTPESERGWRSFRVPLGGGGRLLLEFEYEGSRPRAPFVGLADLRVALPFASTPAESAPDAPNVVLIVIDTLRADRLHAYGNPLGVSPNMDRLAEEGLRFEFAASSGPWTIPGTASVLTGRSSPAHGLGDTQSDFLADRLATLPELFRRAGATTAAFSTNPLISEARNFDQGFEFFRTYRWAPSGPVRADLLEWIRGVGPRRFFLYVHFTDPHAPYVPSEETRELLGIEPDGDLPVADLRQRLEAWLDGGEDIDEATILAANAQRLALYDGEIHEVDAVIGEMLSLLDEVGLGDRTLICVTSDHGEEFLEHGLVGHYNQLHRESIHVPLIFWGPGVPRGVAEEPVENRYLAPTLLRLARVEGPDELAGPDLTREDERLLASRRGVLATSNKGRVASLARREFEDLGHLVVLREDGWSLIHHTGSGASRAKSFDRLYRLTSDPEEQKDVSHLHPARVEAMRARALEWLEAERALRPEQAPQTQETRALMQSLGYIGGDEDDE